MAVSSDVDCAIGNTEDTLPLDMMNLDRFGELEAAMHPSTPTGASSQDPTRVNCGSMVSLAPRTLHFAPCTLHLAPRTSHLAPRLPCGSQPSCHRTCSLVLWLEGAPAPLLLASRLATPLPSDLLSRPLARVACLTARTPLAIEPALSSLGARAHLHLFRLLHSLSSCQGYSGTSADG